MLRITGAFLLATLMQIGAASAQMAPIPDNAGADAGAVEAYRIAPGDRIEVTVLEDPSLNRQALILPDGRVSIPIAGTIVAGGATPEQVAAQIRNRLASIFVTPPTVTVSVLALTDEEDIPALVYVIGQVGSPGAVPLQEDKPRTVIQVLALAGGPGPFAARSRIQVHRMVDGAKVVDIFDYEALEDGRATDLGPELLEGDVIVVPERSLFD